MQFICGLQPLWFLTKIVQDLITVYYFIKGSLYNYMKPLYRYIIQIHQYQQNQESPFTLTHWTQIRSKTYHIGNPGPDFKETQTCGVQKDKQRSTKHTYKTKDRVTRTPLKTGGELMCFGRVSSSPFRYIDDVLLLSHSRFGDFVARIYPIELEIKDTTDTDRPASYLDIHLEIDS
jgi:hypothetical protein